MTIEINMQTHATFEDSLPDVAARPVRRSFLEPKRQGEVGSFRRRGEVGRTTTKDEYD
jgi:hypothetical protein